MTEPTATTVASDVTTQKPKMSTTSKVIMFGVIGIAVVGICTVFGYAIYNARVRVVEPAPTLCTDDETTNAT